MFIVTSQEAIDSVVKITGNDFSKIQGRFNTRLSLSSSSVDEVIKKRVLAKTEDADHLLQMEYEKEASGLKSLFAIDNPILDIKGFTSAAEFSATFPFVPYQFIVIQKVLAEIRKHGNSGKHLSGGERSMLSGFQEAAQKVENKDENALVPFYQFYDTVHTFLESAIRRVIDRCQNAADANDGLEQQDVNVLKLLYLVRYIEDVKANIENIAILMIDDIHTDKIALRASITASLERLLSQNYISRNGDTYAFLTDEEQDIAIDIKNTPVDSAQIVQSISQTVYGEIYPAKKYKYGKYDLALTYSVKKTINLRLVYRAFIKFALSVVPENISLELEQGYKMLKEDKEFPSYRGSLFLFHEEIPTPCIAVYESDSENAITKYFCTIDIYQIRYIVPLDFNNPIENVPDEIIMSVDCPSNIPYNICPFDYSDEARTLIQKEQPYHRI